MYNQTYLAHFGVLGQKWGIRRYQNEDGTLTDEGRRHYGKVLRKSEKNIWSVRSKIQKNETYSKITGLNDFKNNNKELRLLENKLVNAQKRTIKEIEKAGYSVNIIKTKKKVEATDLEKVALVAAPPMLSAPAYFLEKEIFGGPVIDYSKYKVRKNG